MASSSRRQIEAWLKTIDVKGSVLDVGGLFMPVKGRTKSWDVTEYRIADVKPSRKGVVSDYNCDFNSYDVSLPTSYFDVGFCLEVTDHFWNPVAAFTNIKDALKSGGLLYISSNFLFPHHTGFDCIRLTDTGLKKILEETGFRVLDICPRFAVDVIEHKRIMDKESKVVYRPGVIGYMVTAQKI